MGPWPWVTATTSSWQAPGGPLQPRGPPRGRGACGALATPLNPWFTSKRILRMANTCSCNPKSEERQTNSGCQWSRNICQNTNVQEHDRESYNITNYSKIRAILFFQNFCRGPHWAWLKAVCSPRAAAGRTLGTPGLQPLFSMATPITPSVVRVYGTIL